MKNGMFLSLNSKDSWWKQDNISYIIRVQKNTPYLCADPLYKAKFDIKGIIVKLHVFFSEIIY